MDDFRKIYWGAIFSVGGIVIGWILNQTAIWLRARHDDKKTLKTVLFHLLETYYLFIRCDYEKQMEIFGKRLIHKLPPEYLPDDLEEVQIFIKQISSAVMQKLIINEVQKELEENQKKYIEAVHSLATVDPITAYFLNTQKNILQTFESFNNSFQTVESELTKIGIGISPKVIFETVKPDIYKDAISDLEKDLNKIAWKINPIIWFRTKRAINGLKAKANVNTNSKIDLEIEAILKKIEPTITQLYDQNKV